MIADMNADTKADHVAALEWAKQFPQNTMPTNNLAAAYQERDRQWRELREALAVCKQAVMEMDHAHFGPNWFTKGQMGANTQFILWRDKATEAIRAAIEGE